MREVTRLILVRHAETPWNSQGQFQGHSDVGLSETGRRQAYCLRERFLKTPIAAFYASDLRRAVETAEIIAASHEAEVRQVAALREINFGLWEGLTRRDIAARHPGVLEQWLRGSGELRVPGGESLVQVRERAWTAIQGIIAAHRGETVLAVSHGGTIRSLLCAVLGLDTASMWRLAQDNAAVNIVDFYSERPVVVLLNDTSHLMLLHKAVAT